MHDEPQHVKQGRVTPELFEAMDIPYVILSDEENVAAEQIEAAAGFINDTGRQMAVIVRKGTFAPFKATDEPPLPYPCREEAIKGDCQGHRSGDGHCLYNRHDFARAVRAAVAARRRARLRLPYSRLDGTCSQIAPSASPSLADRTCKNGMHRRRRSLPDAPRRHCHNRKQEAGKQAHPLRAQQPGT